MKILPNIFINLIGNYLIFSWSKPKPLLKTDYRKWKYEIQVIIIIFQIELSVDVFFLEITGIISSSTLFPADLFFLFLLLPKGLEVFIQIAFAKLTKLIPRLLTLEPVIETCTVSEESVPFSLQCCIMLVNYFTISDLSYNIKRQFNEQWYMMVPKNSRWKIK